MSDRRDVWSGRTGFILATTGSAVGLGSIWKFPYEVGAHGGAAFLLFYLLGVTLIVFPLMLAEFAIGRRGGVDAARGLAAVAVAYRASARWRMVGLLGVATSVLILSFSSVIGGWAIAYAVDTVLHGLPGGNPHLVQQRFDTLMASPLVMIACHALFMGATGIIVARGVAGGIETASRVLMPALVLLIVVLAVFSMTQGDFGATARFLFALDPAHVSAHVALEAVGLGFFSIGVGLCLMVTYAAYADADMDLRNVAAATIVADTVISLMAGFAVFPIVFAEGLDPASGAGLMFVTVPVAFAKIPFGAAAAALFFVLLVIAALASAISLLEMPVALLSRQAGWTRPRAAIACAAACWACGLATVFSFNIWSGWYPLRAIPGFARATVFDLIDRLTSDVMLPLGGLGLAVFAGWALPPRFLADELRLGPRAASLLRALLRYAIPAGILALTAGHITG
jgi:NSS family neurotransmitter:Na+ symporter